MEWNLYVLGWNNLQCSQSTPNNWILLKNSLESEDSEWNWWICLTNKEFV